MKTCTKCGASQPPERFAIDRSKSDGRDSWCRDCRNKARMQRYNDQLGREQQRSRDYYAAHRDQKNERSKRYRDEHHKEILAALRARWRDDPAYRARRLDSSRQQHLRTYDPAKERLNYMKRHGGIDEWARMWESQGGCCYLCGETLEGTPQKMIAVDHDHDCCPGGTHTQSCGNCRRGLTHAWCNQLIGLAGEDVSVLRTIAENLERVSAETKAKIAAKPRTLALGIDTVRVGAPWPDGNALF